MNDNPESLVRKAITSRSLEFDLTSTEAEPFIQSGFLKQTSAEKRYSVHIQSGLFIDTAITLIAADMGIRFPLSIREGLETILAYDEFLKSKYSDNTFNAFHFLTYPLSTQLLVKLHKEGRADILSFYKSVADGIVEFEHWRFSEFFFKALPQLALPVEEITGILLAAGPERKSDSVTHEKTQFVKELTRADYDRAVALYDYGKEHGLQENIPVYALLMAALHDAGHEKMATDAEALFLVHPEISVIFYGAITKRSDELSKYILSLAKHIPPQDHNLSGRYIYTILKLLEQDPASAVTTLVFDILLQLLRMKDEQVTNQVISNLIWIDGYETERYQLLRTGLREGLVMLAVVRNYFRDFKSCVFFFELFEQCCIQFATKTPLKIFEGGYDHFLRVDREVTQRRTMELLTHKLLFPRRAILSLFIFARDRSKRLDLLGLPTPDDQLRAAEAMFSMPMGIENLIPLMVTFRKSQFPEVVQFVQKSLGQLVFSSYHEHGWDLIRKQLTDSEEDQKFLAPVLDALNAYKEYRELKGAVKDLDPRANEKSLMQLYYKLEAEKNAKTLDSVNSEENSFMSMVKNVQIVRGNAWKIEGRNVEPLGTFGHSFALDARMFRNPEQYEIELNFGKSQF